MIIYSKENGSWLRIEQSSNNEGYVGYEVDATVDIGHGQFRAQNQDLQWLNIADFAERLDEFILNRELRPRLEGTYDSFLEFSGTSNFVIVEFAIGDAFCGNKTHDYLFSGSFEIHQESLIEIVREFTPLRNDS